MEGGCLMREEDGQLTAATLADQTDLIFIYKYNLTLVFIVKYMKLI